MKYTLRALKYLVKLALLLALVFALMKLSGTSNIASDGGIAGFFKAFFATSRGQVFSAALLVWCAIYPAVEYKRRLLGFDMAKNKEAIIKALRAGGLTLSTDEDGRMVFRGESLVRRLWWLGEDALTVTRGPEGRIEIEGPRRFVMEAEHRIPRYIDVDS